MSMFKARIGDKLGKTKPNVKNLQIIETGEDDNIKFIKLNTGQVFFHRFFIDL